MGKDVKSWRTTNVACSFLCLPFFFISPLSDTLNWMMDTINKISYNLSFWQQLQEKTACELNKIGVIHFFLLKFFLALLQNQPHCRTTILPEPKWHRYLEMRKILSALDLGTKRSFYTKNVEFYFFLSLLCFTLLQE